MPATTETWEDLTSMVLEATLRRFQDRHQKMQLLRSVPERFGNTMSLTAHFLDGASVVLTSEVEPITEVTCRAALRVSYFGPGEDFLRPKNPVKSKRGKLLRRYLYQTPDDGWRITTGLNKTVRASLEVEAVVNALASI